MSKTYAELLEVAEQIRQNELPESNTHDLVGGLLRDLIDFYSWIRGHPKN